MDKEELIKIGIKEGSFPKVLYKYRCFTEYTEDIFKHNGLWFSKPSEFNDPFEYNIFDKGKYSKDDLFDYFKSNNFSDEDAEYHATKYDKSPEALIEIIEESKTDIFNNKGVLCLSKRPDSILMWSHYSSNHTGFVLGFNLEKDISFYNTPFNVTYQDNYPSISYLKERKKIIDSCVRTKYSDWKYEEEVRILKTKSGLHTFRKEALCSIIMGCKISPDDKQNLLTWIDEYNYENVNIFKAEMSKTKYEIELTKI